MVVDDDDEDDEVVMVAIFELLLEVDNFDEEAVVWIRVLESLLKLVAAAAAADDGFSSRGLLCNCASESALRFGSVVSVSRLSGSADRHLVALASSLLSACALVGALVLSSSMSTFDAPAAVWLLSCSALSSSAR